MLRPTPGNPWGVEAAYCESGTHWVHYHCDTLIDLEIHRLENDDGVIYNCKNCLSHNTCPKTVARDVDNSESCVAPQNRNSVLQLPSINNASDLSSPAMVILNEKVASVCGVCDNSLENDEASKMISNDQELIQSDPTSCPQNQKGNN